MGQEKCHATLLKGRYGKLVGNVHQAFDVVPGNGAFGTTDLAVSYQVQNTPD